MNFADRTGQQENYSLYGADAGTPSVLSEFGGDSLEHIGPLNSTSVDPHAPSLHLNITESVIQQPSRFDTQEIEEEDLDGEEAEDSAEENTSEELGSCSETESSTEGQGSRQQVKSDDSSPIDQDGSMQQASAGGSRQQTSAGGSRQQDAFEPAEVSVSSLNTRRRNMKAKTPNQDHKT